MAQQTAVEWLWRWIMDNPFASFDDGVKAYTQAKAMEKDQTVSFANSFYDDCVMEGGSLQQSADEYYNQTYQSNKD